MKFLRRSLGILVMIAGILGLVLSLAGLITVWTFKPTIANAAATTLVTLDNSISTSQNAMEITGEALGATVSSVDALSAMLSSTAQTVDDTKPVFQQINGIMGETLPSALNSATSSLETAQQAAAVLDSAIRSLNSFRTVLAAAPLVGAFVEQPSQAYNPEVPLADSLGDLAASLEGLPETFSDMSVSLDKADDNLDSIQTNLVTMSDSVALISQSLGEYQAMIGQSKSSMDNLKAMLSTLQANLNNILNAVGLVLSLFLLWLLAAQVVILSQGWELYQGTAGRMEGAVEEAHESQPVEA